MKVLDYKENKKISSVYIGEFNDGKVVEFADSLQPPFNIRDKWVLLISTLYGCPVKCKMCDAGSSMDYGGILSKEEILKQIDYMVKRKFPKGIPKVKKFKIQFARMGEPSFNNNVLEVLEELPKIYNIKGLIPSVSTIAPVEKDSFFDKLIQIKDKYYSNGKFQLQFSIHTTDDLKRDWLIPINKWSFVDIANYGERFFKKGDRKITLNFALAKGMPLEAEVLSKFFSPDKFLIKITPLNPTYQVQENKLSSYLEADKNKDHYDVFRKIGKLGYDVILSIGEIEENRIGSNCGQYVLKHLQNKTRKKPSQKSYDYWQGESSVIF